MPVSTSSLEKPGYSEQDMPITLPFLASHPNLIKMVEKFVSQRDHISRPHLTPLSSSATVFKPHQDWQSSPDYHVSCRILVGLLFLDYCCLQPKPVLDPKLCLDFESCLAFWKTLLCLAYLLPTFSCSATWVKPRPFCTAACILSAYLCTELSACFLDLEFLPEPCLYLTLSPSVLTFAWLPTLDFCLNLACTSAVIFGYLEYPFWLCCPLGFLPDCLLSIHFVTDITQT